MFGASYEFAVGADSTVQLNATYKYTSSKYLTAIDNANRSWVQPTNLVDANIEYSIADKYSISLWGKNIFDKKYRLFGIDFGSLGFAGNTYGEPATYGVDFRVKL